MHSSVISAKKSTEKIEWEILEISPRILYRNTEKLHKKDLNDPANHNDVITYLEPDILECKVKWVLGNITTNKASGGDGIPLSYFKSWKMML